MRWDALSSYTAAIVIFTGVVFGQNCPPLHEFLGEPGDVMGYVVGNAGDVNRDGANDVIVGAPQHAINGPGRAYVFSGRDGRLLHRFGGEEPEDSFGIYVDGAGDVNRDGHADLIVGAIRGRGGLGAAYVFSGRTGELLHIFVGEGVGEAFGYCVAGAGDVNADGNADLIVGAKWNNAGGTLAGRAYVYSGRDGSLLHVFTGSEPGEVLGRVAGAGDVNGDGHADLVVGGHGLANRQLGVAYVFSGRDGSLIHRFTGEQGRDRFGRTVAGAGDVTGDGYADLIIGAFQAHVNGVPSGRAYVFSGRTGELLHRFSAEGPEHNFGLGVGSAGDVDGDGYADVIVGAPLWSGEHRSMGRAYVFSGKTGDLLEVFTGVRPLEKVGRSVAGLGDLNGNGSPEVILSAHGRRDFGWGTGAAYVLPTRCQVMELRVNPDPLRYGERFIMSVSNATPNENVFFVYSLTGPGSTFVPRLRLWLDLSEPLLAARRIADSQGAVRANFPIPGGNQSRTVWFQAAGAGRTSNVVERQVVP